MVPQKWVFGILCMQYNPPRPLFYVVINRTQRTLHRIIRHHIAPGSTISTDEWRGYLGLNQWYRHETVCHRRRFVNAAGKNMKLYLYSCHKWLGAQVCYRNNHRFPSYIPIIIFSPSPVGNHLRNGKQKHTSV